MMETPQNLTAIQNVAFERFKIGMNLFITGQAGTGKSFLVQRLVNWCKGNNIFYGVTSMTGVSALLINGTTLHRWTGIKLGVQDFPDIVDKVVKKNWIACKNWRQASILIIDEVSMLTPLLLTKLDKIGQTLRRNPKPFGGIQIIMIGDFCQLPPVKTDQFCFECETWQELFPAPENIVYLTEIMRQHDPEFQVLLSEIRLGQVSRESRQILTSRLKQNLSSEDYKKIFENQIKPTRLFSNRRSVDNFNAEELVKLVNPKNKLQKFKASFVILSMDRITEKQKGYFKATMKKSCPAREILELAIGAQVMLVTNLDMDKGLVNGSRGVLTGWDSNRPIVEFRNGLIETIKTHSWDLKLSCRLFLRWTQIPLILAWASSIHKCQGATIDLVEADLGSSIFEKGQFYTACSRVKSIDSLVLTDLDFDKVMVSEAAETFYHNLI